MTHGTVKFFNASKGFGFITPDEGKDIFVSATSVLAAGIKTLTPGQRVSFEIKPEPRGPVAINLSHLAEPPRQQPVRDIPLQNPATEDRRTLTFYFDPADQAAQSILDNLHDAGCEPKVVDYIAVPPKRDELKALASVLSKKNQSLVRKYAPLFYDLRLDDRFLSQNEFWDAIVEHPALINGPIIATAFDANLCGPKSGIDAFLAAIVPNAVPIALAQTKAAELAEEDEVPPIAQGLPGDDELELEVISETTSPLRVLPGRKSKAADASPVKRDKPLKSKVAAKRTAVKSAKKPDLATL